jgi:quercetin dioxygenase-like cupin family protein
MSDSDLTQTADTDTVLDEQRQARMRARLLASAGRDMAVVRAESAGWQRFLPGIRIKLLNIDHEQGMQTALWRMAPGARIPPHPHSKDEECFLLEGSMEHRGQQYVAGDYMLAPAGSRHSAIVSAEGAMMLIRGERVSWRERLLLRASLLLGR